MLPTSDFLLDLADWLRSFHGRLSITVKCANHAEWSESRFQHLPDFDSALDCKHQRALLLRVYCARMHVFTRNFDLKYFLPEIKAY